MFTQYWWKDDTEFPNSSMTLLRLLQNKARAVKHSAITKWETELGRMMPKDLWQATWLPKCAASENTFLWHVIYQSIAT